MAMGKMNVRRSITIENPVGSLGAAEHISGSQRQELRLKDYQILILHTTKSK